MINDKEHQFRIDVFTPETLPMERLAEYMTQFAKLLGEAEHVHFVEVGKGSAVLRARTDAIAAPKVERRLLEARNGQGDHIALKALQALDDLLADDNAIGQLLESDGAEIIAFPGRTRPKPLEYGPFREEGVLEGVVIKVGGKDDSVPVWLQDGENVHRCTATVEMSKRLSMHYRRGLLRVKGTGRWMREANGTWKMIRFDIADFEILDDAPLTDVIRRLQAVAGADWGDDPLRELRKLRTGEGIN
jgi:hypothetical protein